MKNKQNEQEQKLMSSLDNPVKIITDVSIARGFAVEADRNNYEIGITESMSKVNGITHRSRTIEIRGVITPEQKKDLPNYRKITVFDEGRWIPESEDCGVQCIYYASHEMLEKGIDMARLRQEAKIRLVIYWK